MNVMTKVSTIGRSSGDPKVLESGPSARGGAERLARALGWFSIGLGVTEVLAGGRLCRALGLEGKGTRAMVRASGAREIAAGVLSLSIDSKAGILSRVAGDGLDIATLLAARRRDNPQRRNVDAALAAVISVTLLDIVCYRALAARHDRRPDAWRDYRDRSGLPRGIEASRGLAREVARAAE